MESEGAEIYTYFIDNFLDIFAIIKIHITYVCMHVVHCRKVMIRSARETIRDRLRISLPCSVALLNII